MFLATELHGQLFNLNRRCIDRNAQNMCTCLTQKKKEKKTICVYTKNTSTTDCVIRWSHETQYKKRNLMVALFDYKLQSFWKFFGHVLQY